MNKVAVRMIKSQPVFEEMEPNPDIPFKNADVCISQEAALEVSHLLTYSMAPKGVSEILKTLESTQLEVKNALLIWLPFKEEGRFWKELNTGLSIEKGPAKR